MKKILFICTSLVGILFFANAQKQGNVWYFGVNAGINFNTTPVSILNNGALVTTEACSSICDDNGNLLFYTNGVTVYNKNHAIMKNGAGLSGNGSATQGATIVPWSDRDSLYYIITADAYENNYSNGYTYSVVNIKGSNGLGEVILKNQLLHTPSSEKVAVAKHCNGKDWWIITKPLGNDQFQCFLIDKNGININPVISSAGTPLTDFTNAIGYMKVSPDGKKLAASFYSYSSGPTGYMEIYDLDNATGRISNAVRLDMVSSYGLEFSPNSNFLYVADELLDASFGSEIKFYQFDVSSYTDAISLDATRVTLTPPNYQKTIGSMQMAPDGKIYIASYFETSLDAILLPDKKGLACNFHSSFLSLEGKFALLGLPYISPNLLVSNTPSLPAFSVSLHTATINPCQRIAQFDGGSDQTTNISYEWDFGDGTTSNLKNPQHIFGFSQNAFTVSLKVTADIKHSECKTVRQSKMVSHVITFDPIPHAQATFINDCDSKIIRFTDQSIVDGISVGGRYWDFGDGQNTTIQHPQHTYTAFGIYTVKLVAKTTATCPSDTFRFLVNVRPRPVASFSDDAVCVGKPVQFTNLSSVNPGNIIAYNWSFGDRASSNVSHPVHTFTSVGSYTASLTVQADNGCQSLPVVRSLLIGNLQVNAGRDTSIDLRYPLQLHGSGGGTYEWSPPEFLNNNTIANPIAVIKQDQVFILKVTNTEGCTGYAKVNVKVTNGIDIYVPNGFTPNGDGYNEILKAVPAGVVLQNFSIYNRWGNLVFSTNDYTQGWDGHHKGQLQPAGTFIWKAKGVSYKGESIIRRGTATLVR